MIFLKPVVLVGMMGVGKTTVARHLAKNLNLPYYDSDEIIEEHQQKKISDIFAQDGEQVFRLAEQEVIKALIEKEICIIATGGGALTSSTTLDLIKAKTHSIWLDTHVDDILKRLERDATRPLLQQENRHKVLQTLLNERQNLYAQADIHIKVQAFHTEEDVVKLVQDALKPYGT
ncbi:MAG: AAA family ATPase [Alphaproteobacteria bacterium]|nr:AAA family ATPase [Alphaproteobacteria bacterium]